MAYKVGVVMDPIASIVFKKDSTLALLLAAQTRGHELLYMELEDLFLRDGRGYGYARELEVRDDPEHWFTLSDARGAMDLGALDVILMRKDPPFDMEYVYATYILERAEAAGALVVNKPASLRDANEKLYTAWFAQCCPPTLVTRRAVDIRNFLREHEHIVVKPPGAMGGTSIFRVSKGDLNTNVILETLTQRGTQFVLAQRFIPEISEGDKRILVIDGEPIPYALARIPGEGEFRGNLAVGASGVGVELSARDRRICSEVGPTLREKGLLFAGLDVIGDYLTEINVTSPTCIRELERLYGLDIGGQIIEAIERHLAAGGRR
ncbi:MAG: glutathione synthase [Gammaproteobacteria bacterium]|nr:glutathione synthase [Gammaproteobacteria bacterium]NIR83369.1 glutathione synthase [Gammaproteobacteria bacterium]NIR91169.1 glutathione synthase [Gammaproteobacteria bacterium]NIU04536.1 glutathione synthase [Gammaproteobacteria bacterium]NIW87172.1 glutathione synthase [Gammaproteobacteria bacterium]